MCLAAYLLPGRRLVTIKKSFPHKGCRCLMYFLFLNYKGKLPHIGIYMSTEKHFNCITTRRWLHQSRTRFELALFKDHHSDNRQSFFHIQRHQDAAASSPAVLRDIFDNHQIDHRGHYHILPNMSGADYHQRKGSGRAFQTICCIDMKQILADNRQTARASIKSHPDGKKNKIEECVKIPIVLPRFSSTLAKLFALTSASPNVRQRQTNRRASSQLVYLTASFTVHMPNSVFNSHAEMRIHCVRRIHDEDTEL